MLTMYPRLILFLLFFGSFSSVFGQMHIGNDTLYGNEWIDYTKPHVKFELAEDGVYRITQSVLAAAGWPVGIQADQFRLFHNGAQVPVYLNFAGTMGTDDFVEFVGSKNRGEIDKYLWDAQKDGRINPEFSMFRDTSAYFLTWSATGAPSRVTQIQNNIANAPAPEPWFYYTLTDAAANRHFKTRESANVYFSWGRFEGFPNATPDSVRTFTLPQLSPIGTDLQVRFRYVNDYQYDEVDAYVNNILVRHDTTSGAALRDIDYQMASSSVTNSQVKIKVDALNGSQANVALGSVHIKYPRAPHAANSAWLQIETASGGGDKYFEITNFNTAGGVVFVYNLTTKTRMEATVTGTTVQFLAPSAHSGEQLLLYNPSLYLKTFLVAKKVNFEQYQGQDAQYLFVTHARLRNHAGVDPVQQYADYRGSAAGGNFSSLIVDINQLYDQYGYGIKFHPVAIRNFLHQYHQLHPQAEHVMLVGKSLEYNLSRSVSAIVGDSMNSVPSIGYPASDLLFVMGNEISKPIMSIGRLAVQNAFQISDYLDKVKQYESVQVTSAQTIQDRLWMKRILHLNGGGQNDGAAIRNIMNTFESRAKTNLLGADVRTFESKTNDPVLESGFSQVQKLFEDGMSLVTYMGHSAATVVTFDLGDPAQYPKSGKFPVFAVFGCYSGNCHGSSLGIGERFVLQKDRAAIAYFASVSWGFTSSLGEFGRTYYDIAGGTGYGKSQGFVLRETVDRLKTSQSQDMIGFLHQFQYQGDPALKLYHQPGSDYTIDATTFQADPNPVSVEEPNFKVHFDVVNLGRNQDSLLTLRIMQQQPNDSVRVVLTDTIPATANRDHLTYTLPSPGEKAVGFNRIFVEVDAAKQIAELPAPISENNNSLRSGTGQEGVDVYFFSNDARPIWPKDYSIVSKDTVSLHSSTLSSTAGLQEYMLQLDTTLAFNSPLFKETKRIAAAGLISWTPSGKLLDSTVYYWRIARDTLLTSGIPWRTASFVYIKDSPEGWNQSHFEQINKNELDKMVFNPSKRSLEFSPDAGYTTVSVGYRIGGLFPGFNNHRSEGVGGEFQFNNLNVQYGMCIAVSSADNGTWIRNPIGHPNNPSPTRVLPFFHFDLQDSSRRLQAMQFLEDSIKAGDIVNIFLMTRTNSNPSYNYAPEKWALDSFTFGRNLYQLLEDRGATLVRSLETQNSVPYGLIYQNGSPDDVVEIIHTGTTSVETIRRNYFAKWNKGSMKSVLIGPAKRWKTAHWRPLAGDHPLDESILRVYQVKDGQPDELHTQVKPDQPDVDISGIDATQFPYLRLVYAALDTIRNTANDLPEWRVLYEGWAEGAIVPNEFVAFSKDTLQQGENLEIGLAFRNISAFAFDSLLVQFRTEGNNGVSQVVNRRVKPLLTSDSLIARATLPTVGLAGKQRLVVDVNYNLDQPELFRFNNVYVRQFFVESDKTNPALTVTFDGRQILNNDIISPKPEIVVDIQDENLLLAMTDTTTFKLFLRYPNGTERQVYLSSPEVLFIPATTGANKNRARVEYRPYLTEDGTYTLRVNGRDATGNNTSGLDYRIDFQVINKSSLSNIMTYPNPFSTSTCFFYTMTGLEQPDQMMVRIMTVSGRVVREVSAAEFGSMQVGTHLSDFCWDGKDQYGDQLANGVYYYQIFAKKANGEPFDLFTNSQTDGFFKNGIGKIVLMR
jgi:Peptidase family C25